MTEPRRFIGWLWKREEIRTLALLPRIRLTPGRSVGLGFGWFTAWGHVWLCRACRRRDYPMIELLPHVWLHWHPRHGAGVHLWFLVWTAHIWFWRGVDNR